MRRVQIFQMVIKSFFVSFQQAKARAHVFINLDEKMQSRIEWKDGHCQYN